MKNKLFNIAIIGLLLGCSNHSSNKYSSEQIAKPIDTIEVSTLEVEKSNTYKSYYFSNDSLCQNLIIKKIKWGQKKDIPKSIEFELTLHDNLGCFQDIKFNGVAMLASSNESFLDESDKDVGAYFAADYIFSSDFKIKIRIDIENYAACVVHIETDKPEKILGGYKNYIKSYPNFNIMKKGSCIK